MKNLVLGMALLAGSVGWGASLTNLVVRSAKMDKDVPVTLVLPAGYAEKEGRYPSIWILHGAGGSGAKKAAEKIIGQAVDKYGFIAVCPDGGVTSWWLDSPIDPKFQYETFVVKEALPVVDAAFRTIPDRKQRAIMGGSMGGHGACYLGMRHTDVFGAIGNIYGGVDLVPWSSNWDIALRLGPRDKYPERWVEHSVTHVAKSIKNGEIELISVLGTEDFFLGCNRQLHELLSNNGVAHTYVEVRAPSTIKSVHGRFYAQGAEIALRFIQNFFVDGYGHLGDVDAR